MKTSCKKENKRKEKENSLPRFPSIHLKTTPVFITGNLKISDMLTNPKSCLETSLS